jgi:hypothetical protein
MQAVLRVNTFDPDKLAESAQRLVNPLLREPSELIGVGPVLGCDLVPRQDA